MTDDAGYTSKPIMAMQAPRHTTPAGPDKRPYGLADHQRLIAERDEARGQADRLLIELNHWRTVIVPELTAERDDLARQLAEMTAHRDATQIEYDEMRTDRDGCRTALTVVGGQRDKARGLADHFAALSERMRPVVGAAETYAGLLRLTNALGAKNSRPAIDLLAAVDAYRSTVGQDGVTS